MTARTLYSCTMSLDGFIAGPGGDMQWLRPHLGPNPVAEDVVDRIGSLLVGRRTFDGDDPNRGTDQEGAFGGRWHGPVFVLTHEPPAEAPDDPELTFLTELGPAVTAAREAAGEKYVNILGAEVARSCLEAGLLDEILVLVAPVLLGDGTRLFDWPGGRSVDLVRRHVSGPPGVVNLWYDVARR
jgi:dihydrofolate reductase